MRDKRDFELKESFREFMANFKLSLMILCFVSAIVSGVVSEAWPKTMINYPLLICIVCIVLFFIIFKSL